MCRAKLARSKFQIITGGADISRFPKVIRGASSSSKEIATQVLSIIVNYEDMGFYGGGGGPRRGRGSSKLARSKFQIKTEGADISRVPVDCQIRGEFPI